MSCYSTNRMKHNVVNGEKNMLKRETEQPRQSGHAILVLLSFLPKLEGHKNNVRDLMAWHLLQNSLLCF